MWARIVLTLCGLLPVQAQALSCLPWTLEHSYSAAAKSDADYVIVRGALNFPKRKLPKVDWSRQHGVPPETRIKARLRGKALSRSGFTVPFDASVTMFVRCAGPWCPSVTPAATYLAFLKKLGSGYQLEFDPCSVMGWQNPTPEMLDRVQACLAGADCTPKQR